MAANGSEEAFCVLTFHERRSVTIVQRQFRTKFGKQPPSGNVKVIFDNWCTVRRHVSANKQPFSTQYQTASFTLKSKENEHNALTYELAKWRFLVIQILGLKICQNATLKYFRIAVVCTKQKFANEDYGNTRLVANPKTKVQQFVQNVWLFIRISQPVYCIHIIIWIWNEAKDSQNI